MEEEEKHTGEASRETSHYISINDPVSQSYIYRTPLVHDSPVSRTEYAKQYIDEVNIC